MVIIPTTLRGRPRPAWASRPAADPDRGRKAVEWAVAAALCVAIGMRYPRYDDILFAAAASAIIAPLWLGNVRRYQGAAAVLILGVLAILSGLLLTGFAAGGHEVSSYLSTMNSARIAGVLLFVGALLWARTILGTPLVASFYGAGMIFALPFGASFATNPWKFGLSVPIAIFVLGLAWAFGHRWVDIALLTALSLVSAANDSRSAAAMFLMAAAIVTMQRIPVARGRAHAWWALGRMAIVGYLVFLLAQAAILEGYLGTSTEQRSEAQIEASGSLILGGRPELGATVSLLLHQPSGYGSGTAPSMTDVLVAKSGMSSLGYDPNNGYVERYMFSPGFEVHSIIGDVWILFGVVGLIWLLITVGFALFGVSTRLTDRRISGLELFLGIRTVWDLFFSPLPSSLVTMTLFIAVILISRVPAARPTSPPEDLDPSRPPRPHAMLGPVS
ncbi:O-antigen ligase domain-containing protein [Plantibacter sp. RU18]